MLKDPSKKWSQLRKKTWFSHHIRNSTKKETQKVQKATTKTISIQRGISLTY